MTTRSPAADTTGKTGPSAPGRGAVINYIYLFAAQQASGRDEGVKERPVVILVADASGYIVVPVTTKGEIDPSTSIAIPTDVGTAMGLPHPESSSVVVSEANSFDWMGHDVRERPNGEITYGVVPPGFFNKILREVLDRRVKPVDRR